MGGGDAFNFNESALRERFDGDGAAGGVGRLEELGVHLVHGGEIPHIGQEDGGFYHTPETEPGRFQDGPGVGKALAGLLLHPSFRESAGARVDGKLSRYEYQPGAAVHRLAVRSDGRWGLFCLNGFHRML